MVNENNVKLLFFQTKMLLNPLYTPETEDRKPITGSESGEKKPELSEVFNKYREARKRKHNSTKDLQEVKHEKPDTEERTSNANARFDWKHFLTAAPLEEENPPDNTTNDIDFEEEDGDIEADGTIQDVEVPESNKNEHVEHSETFTKGSKPHLNKSAWNSLFGRNDPPPAVDTTDPNYTNCEFCETACEKYFQTS